MFGDEPNFEKGDKMGCVCKDCGDRYTHIEKVEQDPPRSTSRCPDCHAKIQEVREKEMAAGTWRCSDEELREAVREAAAEVGVETYVEDRTSDVHFYYEDDNDQ